MCSIRWVFDFESWKPTESEWLFAARCIQQEEKDRIGRFAFTNDSKSSMAGRLMIRKLITDYLSIPWCDIQLARYEKGKPYLANIDLVDSSVFPNFNFNVSHDGRFVVLAAEGDGNCGIDVMDVERPGNRAIPDYLNRMQRTCTAYEWSTIRAAGTEWQQLEMFYREWCLKESYVKAVGEGLAIGLLRMEFHPKTLIIKQDVIATDTEMYFDGNPQSSWHFEETKLDENHLVAVAVDRKNQGDDGISFKLLTFSDLTSSAKPLLPEDVDYWTSFASKREKPNRKMRVRDIGTSKESDS